MMEGAMFGQALNASLLLVNGDDLVYMVSEGYCGSISRVRDRGIELTFEAEYQTPAELFAAPCPAGSYLTCTPAGMVKLGAAPDGPVTADLTYSDVRYVAAGPVSFEAARGIFPEPDPITEAVAVLREMREILVSIRGHLERQDRLLAQLAGKR